LNCGSSSVLPVSAGGAAAAADTDTDAAAVDVDVDGSLLDVLVVVSGAVDARFGAGLLGVGIGLVRHYRIACAYAYAKLAANVDCQTPASSARFIPLPLGIVRVSLPYMGWPWPLLYQ
jgi:hypothetical protein